MQNWLTALTVFLIVLMFLMMAGFINVSAA